MYGQFPPSKSFARVTWSVRSGLTRWHVKRTCQQPFFFKCFFLNTKLSLFWLHNYKKKNQNQKMNKSLDHSLKTLDWRGNQVNLLFISKQKTNLSLSWPDNHKKTKRKLQISP
jgi:hypothetical protein